MKWDFFFMKWKNETMLYHLVNEQFMSLIDLVRCFIVRMTLDRTLKWHITYVTISLSKLILCVPELTLDVLKIKYFFFLVKRNSILHYAYSLSIFCAIFCDVMCNLEWESLKSACSNFINRYRFNIIDKQANINPHYILGYLFIAILVCNRG